MAHEFESGMFVRQPAWHQLGNVLANVPTTDEAFVASGLNWRVAKYPLYYRFGNDFRGSERYAIVRETDGKALGYACDRYQCFQNKEAFDWCNPLIDSGFWRWESAGSLRGGQICWLLLKQSEYQLFPNDTLKDYLLMTWSHDTSKSIQIAPVSIRVVCMNTLKLALGRADVISIKHTRGLYHKIENVRELYAFSLESFKRRNEKLSMMIDTDWDDHQLEEFAKTIFPVDESDNRMRDISQKVQQEAIEFLLADKASGQRELGIRNTAYGAVMALTEFNEHYLGGKRIKDRGMNILFGKGFERNQKIFATALSMVAQLM